MPHVPSKLFQFTAHLRFGLPEIPGRGWQDPAFETHLLAATARIVWHFVLFDIASDLSSQSARLLIRWMYVAMRGGTFCCRHSTHAFRLGVVISVILRLRYPQSERVLEQPYSSSNSRSIGEIRHISVERKLAMKRRGTAAKKLAFYVVIGPAATGANRKAGNNRSRTAREIFVVSFVSNFLCSRPEPQKFLL